MYMYNAYTCNTFGQLFFIIIYQALISGWNNYMPDSALSASAEHRPGLDATHSRFDVPKPSSWSVSGNDRQPWIQVNGWNC